MTVLTLGSLLVAVWPFAAHLKRAPASRLFAAAAIGFGLLAALQFTAATSAGGSIGIVLIQATANRAHHDTYYVVAQSHYSLSIAFVFSVLAAGQYIKERAARTTDDAWTKRLFWLLLAAVLAATTLPSLIAQAGPPHRYAEYPDWFRMLNLAMQVPAHLASAALLGLAALLTVAPFLRWYRSKG